MERSASPGAGDWVSSAGVTTTCRRDCDQQSEFCTGRAATEVNNKSQTQPGDLLFPTAELWPQQLQYWKETFVETLVKEAMAYLEHLSLRVLTL